MDNEKSEKKQLKPQAKKSVVVIQQQERVKIPMVPEVNTNAKNMVIYSQPNIQLEQRQQQILYS